MAGVSDFGGKNESNAGQFWQNSYGKEWIHYQVFDQRVQKTNYKVKEISGQKIMEQSDEKWPTFWSCWVWKWSFEIFPDLRGNPSRSFRQRILVSEYEINNWTKW